MQKTLIADLECLIVEKSHIEAEYQVVLFHGYGATCFDLYPFHEMLDHPKIKRWIFPDGFLKVPIGPHFSAHAWFPVDEAALEEALARGGHRDFSQIRPDGFDEAVAKAEACLAKLQIPTDKLILGGFSQGAMLATEIALRQETNIAALLILSGAFLDEKHWQHLAARHTQQAFFQCHGKSDPLLSPKEAFRLFEILKEKGFQGSLFSFSGGHEIPAEALRKIAEFIHEICSSD